MKRQNKKKTIVKKPSIKLLASYSSEDIQHELLKRYKIEIEKYDETNTKEIDEMTELRDAIESLCLDGKAYELASQFEHEVSNELIALKAESERKGTLSTMIDCLESL